MTCGLGNAAAAMAAAGGTGGGVAGRRHGGGHTFDAVPHQSFRFHLAQLTGAEPVGARPVLVLLHKQLTCRCSPWQEDSSAGGPP